MIIIIIIVEAPWGCYVSDMALYKFQFIVIIIIIILLLDRVSNPHQLLSLDYNIIQCSALNQLARVP